MKTFLLSFIAFWLLLAPATAENLFFRIIPQEGEAALTVQLANLKKERSQLFLKSIEGQTHYSEYITGQNGYAVKLKLERLKDGYYLLGLESKKESHIRAFSLKDGKVSLFHTPPDEENTARGESTSRSASSPRSREGALLAHIKAAAGTHIINVRLANLQGETARLRIGGRNSVNWHTEQIDDADGYSKNFNTEGMPAGRYFIFLQARHTAIIQFFEIEEGRAILSSQQRLEGLQEKEPAS